MHRRFIPFLAWRHVRRRPMQSLLTTLGVAVGVAALIIALSLTNGFIDELITSTLRATPMVSLQSFTSGGSVPADEAVLTSLQHEPNVTGVAPFVAGQALIARRASASLGISARQGYTQMLGIDPELQQTVLPLPQLQQLAETFAGESGIVLGSSLAQQLGVITGDLVMLRDINGRTAQFTVAGVFHVGNEMIDGVTSYLPIADAQEFLQLGSDISGYHLRVHNPLEASSVGQALGRSYGLLSVPWDQLFGSLVSQLRLQKTVIGIVIFLIVLVAAIGIANTLVLQITEKRSEIGILRAYGATQREVLHLFLLEALYVGGAGTVLGIAVGLGAAWYFQTQPFPLPGDLYFITQLPMRLEAREVLGISVLSLGTALLASVVPTRRAAKVDPATVLK